MVSKTKKTRQRKPKRRPAAAAQRQPLTHNQQVQTPDDVQAVRSLAIMSGKQMYLGYTQDGNVTKTHFAMPDGTVKSYRGGE